MKCPNLSKFKHINLLDPIYIECMQIHAILVGTSSAPSHPRRSTHLPDSIYSIQKWTYTKTKRAILRTKKSPLKQKSYLRKQGVTLGNKGSLFSYKTAASLGSRG